MGGERARSVEALSAALRGEILSGALGAGAPLREEQIALRFGLSRHTVRAALAQLVSEHLAVSEPFKGVRVTRFDDDQVAALADLRRALESEAVRIVAARNGGGRWPDVDVAPIEAAIDELDRVARGAEVDWSAVESAHAAVHLALVEAARSPRLTEAYRMLGAEVALLLLHTRPEYERRLLADEHRRLLDEVQARGDAAIAEHIAESTAMLVGRREG
ncbi:GntR family transcriptional regulator [Herbiconiux sp. L3-i23]|uniref:GntR family transcriptional regulator n=1 Tax=Herbiconiux sp. L3-i23 TaxID=2905871 RepID=UPI0020643169|nr:GntR family transcriptional regulator [Herbiconiux sp. L3-i23]BDI23125.1 transcriptional regulator [Herbiconiux sp. L3-i23]